MTRDELLDKILALPAIDGKDLQYPRHEYDLLDEAFNTFKTEVQMFVNRICENHVKKADKIDGFFDNIDEDEEYV